MQGALLTPWDANSTRVLARTRLHSSQFKFYQDGGTYRLTVVLAGYGTETRTLVLREGSPPQSFSITLRPSSTPLFIQRVIPPPPPSNLRVQ